MLDKLRLDDFSKCLNQKFTIRVEGLDPLETELIEARGLPAADDDSDRRQPFSLVFRGPADVTLEQGIFRIENDTLGSMEIFLVTVGADQEGMRHEAVFS